MALTIGYYGGSIVGSNVSIETNRIGGFPIIPAEMTDHGFFCEDCGSQLVLISQLCCPLDSSELCRNLYIFICSVPACSRWNVFRLQYTDKSVKRSSPVLPTGKTSSVLFPSWCPGSDDWGDEADVSIPAELATEQAEMDIKQPEYMCISREIVGNGAKFAPFYIDAVNADDQSSDDSGSETNDSEEVLNITKKENANDSWQDEEYEQPSLSFDLCTYKFLKRINEDPKQILRYSIGGSPLCFKPFDTPLPCPRCASPRQFECQLMPNFSKYLKPDAKNTAHLSSLDFTTVLVYTCPMNCGPNFVPAREASIMQVDTDCDKLNLLPN